MSEQEPAEATNEEQGARAARRDNWQRRALGVGAAAAIASAVLAVTANLSEIAGWFAPDETRELVEQTRGVIVGTDEKVEELLALLRNQAAASGVDLNIESEAAIKNAIHAIVASGNAQKKTALELLDAGDVDAAAALMSNVAQNQAAAVGEAGGAAASSYREAGALYYTYDIARAVESYEAANRLQPGDPVTLDMLGHSLVRAGRLDDAARVFEEVLAANAPPAEGSSAHRALGTIAKQRGHYPEADEQFNAALQVAEEHGLARERIYALVALAQLAMSQGDAAAAGARLRAALSLATEIADAGLQAEALDTLGTIEARQQRFDAAETAMRQALDIHELRNNQAGRAHMLGNLGALAMMRGDNDVAETILLETVELGEQLGWQSSVAYDLVNLAGIASMREDFAEADRRLGRAQAIAEQVGLDELAPVIVYNRGDIANDRGDTDAACGYWLEALPLLDAMGSAYAETARGQVDAAGCAAPAAARSP